MARYETYEYGGYRFVFKYDDDFPDLLHIWVRHRKTVKRAMEIWFEATKEVRHQKFQRFETYTDTDGIFWIWLDNDRVIMIISCFDRQRARIYAKRVQPPQD